MPAMSMRSITAALTSHPKCHCEERSDKAISTRLRNNGTRLRRCARNDKAKQGGADGPVRIAHGGWLVSATAALLMLVAAGAPVEALQCPVVAGETLAYVGVFDGPPENQADLAPDEQ